MISGKQFFWNTFGPGSSISLLSAPGRVNLIGEHIDYQRLPVLPMAIQRRVTIAYRLRDDRYVRAASQNHAGVREFTLSRVSEPEAAGDWVNYLKAAAVAVLGKWPIRKGIDAAVVSDLPEAAGLSSSSALLTAFALAILDANGIRPTFAELFSVLPEAEQFVGTRGGGMDHAAILAARPGCALLVGFDPPATAPIPIPQGWNFLAAHSMGEAEKSGDLRREFNSRREAGSRALAKLGLPSYGAALGETESLPLPTLAEDERMAFLHVTGEGTRVAQAVQAMHEGNAAPFGALLTASHQSLRDQLRVSTPELDELVDTALAAGACGARLTGAGFGGFAVVFCLDRQMDTVRKALLNHYYSKQPGFDEANHLFIAKPSAGALGMEIRKFQ